MPEPWLGLNSNNIESNLMQNNILFQKIQALFRMSGVRKEPKAVNTHPMIVSPPEEIAAWNENVTRKKREKTKAKILRRLKAQGVQNMPLA